MLNRLVSLVFIIIFVLIFIPTVTTSHSVHAATYTVTKTEDSDDATCDSDCSLREAIDAANGNTGFDTIEFAIPESDPGFVASSSGVQSHFVSTISSSAWLSPNDESGVFINGYSQPGSSRNTQAFGTTLDTILKIRLVFTDTSGGWYILGNDFHMAGLNMTAAAPTTSIYMDGVDNGWIEGNYLGSDITGTIAEAWSSIEYDSTANTEVIGTNGDGVNDVGERNVIMAHASGTNGAIYFTTAGTDITIAGNYIGVNKTTRSCGGTTHTAQLNLQQGDDYQIGTDYDGVSDSEEGNIIACVTDSPQAQILLGTNMYGVIQGNYIGTNMYDDDLKSSVAAAGIYATTELKNFLIQRNIIARNGLYGIGFSGDNSNQNYITQNNIHDNGGIPVDLNVDGVSANDETDDDNGPNHLQNFPVLTHVSYSGNGYYHIDGTLPSSIEAPYTIEICTSLGSVTDRIGCQHFVKTFTTNGGNFATDVYLHGDTGAQNRIFTAIAISTDNNTSEYGPNIEYIYDAPKQQIEVQSNIVKESGCSNQMPVGVPDLYEIHALSKSVILRFTPIQPVSEYVVSYGLSDMIERYGASFAYGFSDGSIDLPISGLTPNTQYFFKVRGGNGCVAGGWSNIMVVKTDRLNMSGGLIYYNNSQTPKRVYNIVNWN